MSRPRVDFSTASRENYNKFCKEHPSVRVEYKTFVKVLVTFNSLLVQHMLETGDDVNLTFGLGELGVNKYKRTMYRTTADGKKMFNLPPDWAATHKLWEECPECKEKKQLVRHLNLHTDGYSYYWMWLPNFMIKSVYIWKFEMNRVHGRLLKTLLRKPNSKYKDLYKTKKSKSFRKDV